MNWFSKTIVETRVEKSRNQFPRRRSFLSTVLTDTLTLVENNL